MSYKILKGCRKYGGTGVICPQIQMFSAPRPDEMISFRWKLLNFYETYQSAVGATVKNFGQKISFLL